jgi:hypothetical protein
MTIFLSSFPSTTDMTTYNLSIRLRFQTQIQDNLGGFCAVRCQNFLHHGESKTGSLDVVKEYTAAVIKLRLFGL